MLTLKFTRLLAGIVCLGFLAGCGSGGDSNTNGTLALTLAATDDTGGRYDATSTVVFSSTASTASTSTISLQGVPVKITTSIHTLSGTPQVFTESLSTDTAGTVTSVHHIAQTTEAIYVDVTASTGGLSQSSSVTIPSL
jgi:hypothetical protein